MAVFMGSFDRTTKVARTVSPWYTYTSSGFNKSDFTMVKCDVTRGDNNYLLPVIFYNKPIVIRPNNSYSGINYTVDGQNISELPNGYIYKLYCYFGYSEWASSRYSDTKQAEALINRLEDEFKVSGDGLAWDLKYDTLHSPDTSKGIFKGASYQKWGSSTSGIVFISDFDISYLGSLLPSDEEAGLTSEVKSLFSDFKPLRVGQNFAPFATNIYQAYNNDLIFLNNINRLLPCFVGFSESVDYLSDFSGVIYGTYSNCLGIPVYANNPVEAVLCCKPGSILLGSQRYYYPGSTNTRYSVSLTYFGVEKVN